MGAIFLVLLYFLTSFQTALIFGLGLILIELELIMWLRNASEINMEINVEKLNEDESLEIYSDTWINMKNKKDLH